jgi:hypothetical protein
MCVTESNGPGYSGCEAGNEGQTLVLVRSWVVERLASGISLRNESFDGRFLDQRVFCGQLPTMRVCA